MGKAGSLLYKGERRGCARASTPLSPRGGAWGTGRDASLPSQRGEQFLRHRGAILRLLGVSRGARDTPKHSFWRRRRLTHRLRFKFFPSAHIQGRALCGVRWVCV